MRRIGVWKVKFRNNNRFSVDSIKPIPQKNPTLAAAAFASRLCQCQCARAQTNEKAPETCSESTQLTEAAVALDAMNSIGNETEFVEVDAFLNAEAAHAKDLGLETDTAVEVAGGTCVHICSGPLLF